MLLVIASTCFWDHKKLERQGSLPRGDLYGSVAFGIREEGDDHFEASIERYYGSRGREVVYAGDDLGAAVAAVNRRIDQLEAAGFIPNLSNPPPDGGTDERLDTDHLRLGLPEHRETIRSYGPTALIRKDPLDQVEQRPWSEIDHVEKLFTIASGSAYTGSWRGRPCVLADEPGVLRQMVGDAPQVARQLRRGLRPDHVVLIPFDNEERRREHIAWRRWLRADMNYLKPEMRRLYHEMAEGRGSEKHFEKSYRRAEQAIRDLPCEGCGRVAWPVIGKPVAGSPEWWADAEPYLACRHCGRCIGLVPGWPQPTDEYPFDQL